MENYFTNQGPVVTANNIRDVHVHAVTKINYEHLDQKQESIYFQYHRPVKDFVGRSSELVRLKEAIIEENKAPIVVVNGLGGIGKSQLVKKFVEQNRWYYQNVVWINSHKSGSLEKSIKSLASGWLQISTYVNGKEKSFQTLIREVLSKLSESRTLMVFDDVDVDESIEFILRMAMEAVRIHIVITSRVQKWRNDSIRIIKLDVFTLEEALEFVSRQLAVSGHDSMEEKKELVEILQNFPLALRQATAHLNYRRKIGNFKISNYINEFNEYNYEYLLNECSETTLRVCSETTLRVFGTTINILQKCGEKGKLALRILRIIAYFDPDHIRSDIFFHLKHSSSEETFNQTAVESAVRLLIQYSMVDGFERQSVLRIHRFVQQEIRIQLEKAKGEERTLREAFQLITAMEKYENFNECHEHGISVFRSAMKFDGLVREFKAYGVMILESLNAFGKYLRAETFGTEISYLYRPED